MESLRLKDQYQALSAFEWEEIPRLAIITGMNGVGKTQLLELIAATLGAIKPPGILIFAASPLEISPKPAPAGYLPALWRLTETKVTHEFFGLSARFNG